MYKHLKGDMEQFLKAVPKARERRKKDKAIAAILQKKHSALLDIPLEKLEPMMTEVLALDRYWRLLLKNNPDLRGSDYDTKEEYEEKAKEDLGYVPSDPVEADIMWFNQLP